MNHSMKEFVEALVKYNLECSPKTIKYIKANPDDINGCGRKGSLDFVADTILGVYVGWACYVHDGDWAIAECKDDLLEANARFTYNLKKIVDKDSCCRMMAWARRYRIATYSSGVDLVGTDDECDKRGF